MGAVNFIMLPEHWTGAKSNWKRLLRSWTKGFLTRSTTTQTFRSSDFYNNLFKKFKGGSGYYGWPGLRYFLYEYETSLLSESRQKKVEWNDLLKTEKDKISIEHIYPQTETDEWAAFFVAIEKEHRGFTTRPWAICSCSQCRSMRHFKTTVLTTRSA